MEKEPRVAHVPFLSSIAEDVQEDRPRRIPQMSTLYKPLLGSPW